MTDICKALGLKRSTFYRRLSIERINGKKGNRNNNNSLNKELLLKLRELKKIHPFWGYRRMWAYLRYRKGYKINQKRIYRLMKGNGLLGKNEKKLKASREFKSKPKASRPRELLGIDATKFWVKGLGWLTLIVLLDWYTKEILNYSISLRNRSGDWLEVLLGFIEREGIGKFSLVSDHGSQPTSRSFMRYCMERGINQIFATYNNPKGNAETERMIRTIKEEVVWINEFETIGEAKVEMEKFVKFYNEKYCHSSIGYRSPRECYQQWIDERNKNAA